MDWLGLFLLVFWSLAYFFAIIHAVKYKRHAIPPFAIALNFAWEIVASIMYHGIIYISWCLLDAIIVALLLLERKAFSNQQIGTYFAGFVINGILCILFNNYYHSSGLSGFVFMSFLWDVGLAACFIYEICKTHWANSLQLCVAVSKLLGDLFAWIIFRRYWIITVFGICVMILNLIYLFFVIRQLINNRDKTGLI